MGAKGVKYCDFRCWHAKGKTCRCWCGGLNHGVERVPEGFDPKYGLSEADFEAMLLQRMKEAKHVGE